jgi:lipopolysaccharide export system protein LptC
MRATAPEPAFGQRTAEPSSVLDNAEAWLAAIVASGSSSDRYSRRVALLKRLLPAAGLGLLLLIAAWPELAPLWDRMRLAFPAIDLREARELRIVNPRYAGLDRLGRPYVVTAAVGRQTPDRQDLMSLEDPRADMKAHNGADVVITAATGVYQSQAQLLDLFGDVTLTHQNGTKFLTDTARVNVSNNSAEGSDPVEGHGPSGDVKAQGFRIIDKGNTIVFTGKSDMLLRSVRPSGAEKTAPPPGLPAPVAATAARAEAEARPMLAAAAAVRPVVKPAVSRGTAAAEKRAARTRTAAHRRAKHPAHKQLAGNQT